MPQFILLTYFTCSVFHDEKKKSFHPNSMSVLLNQYLNILGDCKVKTRDRNQYLLGLWKYSPKQKSLRYLKYILLISDTPASFSWVLNISK